MLFLQVRQLDERILPNTSHHLELDHLLKICLQKDVTLRFHFSFSPPLVIHFRPSAVSVRHHCWLTQEPLSAYLKAQAGDDDSGDEANEATELLEMNEIEFESRDVVPLRCVLRLRKSL